MPQHKFSESVLGLVQTTGSARVRTLLKTATELFVAEQRHSRAEIAMYEELALQLLPATFEKDRVSIATMLAGYEHAPGAVLRALIFDDSMKVAQVVISRTKHIPEVDLLALIASGSSEHHMAVASRPQLSERLIEALANKLTPDSLATLVANPAVRIPSNVLDHLRGLAGEHPQLAIALSRRHEDIEDTDLVDYFLELDSKGRRRVVQGLEILALRDFAARRAMPRTPTPAPEIVAEMTRAALSRYDSIVSEKLAQLLDIRPDLAAQLLEDVGGEPLAIALKAAGLDAATATRLILFSGSTDTRTYFEVKRLVDLYENVSLRSALLLVSRWRGDSLSGRRPAAAHVPQTEAGTPVRSGAAGTAQRPVARPLDRRESA